MDAEDDLEVLARHTMSTLLLKTAAKPFQYQASHPDPTGQRVVRRERLTAFSLSSRELRRPTYGSNIPRRGSHADGVVDVLADEAVAAFAGPARNLAALVTGRVWMPFELSIDNRKA